MKKSSALRKSTKPIALAAALILTACSGHRVGDPTEKYGDLQRLATDTVVRTTQDPTRAPRIDIDLKEMPRIAYEGERFSFQVQVRMDVGYEDVPHSLNASSNNRGVTLHAELDKASGALTYWNVTAVVAEDLLQSTEDAVELTFDVIFGAIADANKAGALRGSTPSKSDIITIKRAVKRAEIAEIRGESRFEVGQRVELEIIVDSKGAAADQLRWENTVLLEECDASRGESCDFSRLLSVDSLEAANKNWTTTAALDFTNWALEEGQENNFLVKLILVSPNGETYQKSKTITVYRPEDLKAPMISLAAQAPEQVAQGENFEVRLNVELAGSVGAITANEQELREQMGEGWQGDVDCQTVSAGKELCTFSGQLSCEAAVGERQVQFVFSAVDGEKIESNSPFTVSFEVLKGEACDE